MVVVLINPVADVGMEPERCNVRVCDNVPADGYLIEASVLGHAAQPVAHDLGHWHSDTGEHV
eukprot:7370422-Lingulodinium_polyedra.AAC.1